MKSVKFVIGTGAALFGILLLVVSSCTKDAEPTNREYQLVWSDEFDGPEGQAPDSEKWTYDIGIGPEGDGWGNNELQYYTDRTENVSLDGEGNLVITAREEVFGGRAFTSGRILTKGLFSQAYGRFEARIKTPFGPGLWPAFWMLGADIDQVGWPQTGEIDMMELRGNEPEVIAGTIHGPGYSALDAIGKDYLLEEGRFDQKFHVFAIEWGENYIDWFVDGVNFQRLTPNDVPGEWVYDDPFFMLLNVAVGGTYVGFPSQDTIWPQMMTVDYVRVYKEVN
ncbi:MAG: glycoside hydrolase family 16 protein [Flavobacteriaceae bacterium]